MPPTSETTPPVPPAAPSPHPKPREVMMGAFVVVAAIVMAIILSPEWRQTVFPFIWPATPEPAIVERAEPVREPEVVGGKIYLSLSPIVSDSHYSLNVYSYDVASGVIEQETGEQNREYLTSDISPDGKSMAVASLTNDGEEVTSNTELFIRDIATGAVTEVVTSSNVPMKRSPQWSMDGTRIVFSALRDVALDQMVPENWDIYTYTLGEATAKFATTGANPQFLPSGDVLVLKNKGISVFRVADDSETLVLPVDGMAGTNMKFDVLDDGTKISWSLPDVEEVHIIDVTSWAPFEEGKSLVIPTLAFWTVFSPGGEFLAMQNFEWNPDTMEHVAINQRLGIFSLRDNTWLDFADLTSYQQDMLFITDWQPTR